MLPYTSTYVCKYVSTCLCLQTEMNVPKTRDLNAKHYQNSTCFPEVTVKI